MSVFLGVDLGTTHVKAALFSEDGALLRMAVTENGTDTVCAAGACYTAENLWERAAKGALPDCPVVESLRGGVRRGAAAQLSRSHGADRAAVSPEICRVPAAVAAGA